MVPDLLTVVGAGGQTQVDLRVATRDGRVLALTVDAERLGGDFARIGRLINQAEGKERGVLISMLACEIALRKQDYDRALKLLQFARGFLGDEYHNLVIAKRQETAIKRFRDEPEFAELIVERRATAFAEGKL